MGPDVYGVCSMTQQGWSSPKLWTRRKVFQEVNVLWENILWEMPTLWGNVVTCHDQGSIQLPEENENVTSRNMKLFLRNPQNNQ